MHPMNHSLFETLEKLPHRLGPGLEEYLPLRAELVVKGDSLAMPQILSETDKFNPLNPYNRGQLQKGQGPKLIE